MDQVPTSSHVAINRVLQSARDLTIAIRLKSDLVAGDGKGDENTINKVILVRKIVDSFFHGSEIAPMDDIPMWAAVHAVTYYCSVSSLVSRILHNRGQQILSNLPSIIENDAAALKGLMEKCAKKLPELESIKEHGWNVYFAEAIDPRDDFATDMHGYCEVGDPLQLDVTFCSRMQFEINLHVLGITLLLNEFWLRPNAARKHNFPMLRAAFNGFLPASSALQWFTLGKQSL